MIISEVFVFSLVSKSNQEKLKGEKLFIIHLMHVYPLNFCMLSTFRFLLNQKSLSFTVSCFRNSLIFSFYESIREVLRKTITSVCNTIQHHRSISCVNPSCKRDDITWQMNSSHTITSQNGIIRTIKWLNITRLFCSVYMWSWLLRRTASKKGKISSGVGLFQGPCRLNMNDLLLCSQICCFIFFMLSDETFFSFIGNVHQQ